MKYILKKKWHPNQEEEVGHVFEEDYTDTICYKHRSEEVLSEELIAPHEIALLVDAGYLEKQADEPTIDLWTTEPPIDTKYWYVKDNSIVESSYFFNIENSSIFRLRTNNCHKTKESAEEALNRLLA
jgi:hypothetical protein